MEALLKALENVIARLNSKTPASGSKRNTQGHLYHKR